MEILMEETTTLLDHTSPPNTPVNNNNQRDHHHVHDRQATSGSAPTPTEEETREAEALLATSDKIKSDLRIRFIKGFTKETENDLNKETDPSLKSTTNFVSLFWSTVLLILGYSFTYKFDTPTWGCYFLGFFMGTFRRYFVKRAGKKRRLTEKLEWEKTKRRIHNLIRKEDPKWERGRNFQMTRYFLTSVATDIFSCYEKQIISWCLENDLRSTAEGDALELCPVEDIGIYAGKRIFEKLTTPKIKDRNALMKEFVRANRRNKLKLWRRKYVRLDNREDFELQFTKLFLEKVPALYICNKCHSSSFLGVHIQKDYHGLIGDSHITGDEALRRPFAFEKAKLKELHDWDKTVRVELDDPEYFKREEGHHVIVQEVLHDLEMDDEFNPTVSILNKIKSTIRSEFKTDLLRKDD